MSPSATAPGYTTLPDGTIIGPDGKPCKACNAFRGWGKMNLKADKAAKPVAAAAAATTAAVASTSAATIECPADSLLLGRHTWTFLHTTASYYPPNPSAHQQQSMLGLLSALPVLYPCSPCATELGAYMSKFPVTEAVKTRVGVERWLCEAHNEVNDRLGKSTFPCDRVGERWRDGPNDSASCDEMK